MKEITTIEQQRLDVLEGVITRNLQAFYKVGTALLEIRESRIYRNTHATFEEYCRGRWDMTSRHAERLMLSANTVEHLRPIGRVPETESQTRPLTRLSAPLQIEAWNRAVETAPEGKITAQHINRVVSEIEGKEERKRHIRVKNIEATEAMHFADIALANLECIRSDDPKRAVAFDYICNWIKKNKLKKTG